MKRYMARGLVLLVVVLLIGCSRSSTSRFYDLTPLAVSRQESAGHADYRTGQRVAVGPVELPTALHRPQIVRRLSANEVELLDFHQWAEPLKDALPRLLVDNLAVLLGADGVRVLPWQKAPTGGDYRLVVRVIALDATQGEGVRLVVQWDILGRAGGRDLWSGWTRIDRQVGGKEVEDLVAAQNEAFDELSRRLAAVLREVLL